MRGIRETFAEKCEILYYSRRAEWLGSLITLVTDTMQLTPEQIQDTKNLINNCLKLLYTDDINLIQAGGLERSITFRLALYIYEAIENVEWINEINQELSVTNESLKIDVEYNKRGLGTKRTPRQPLGAHPDIILHRRENDERNILVVEIKGWWDRRDRQRDINKLEDLTHQNGEYKYGLGVFLELGKNGYAEPVYFHNY